MKSVYKFLPDSLESGRNLGHLGTDGMLTLTSILGQAKRLLHFDTTRTAKKTTCPLILLLRLFVAAVPFLQSRCLATVGDTYIRRLMGGIYEVRRLNGLRCRDIYTKFHRDWFRHLEVAEGIHRQHSDIISHKQTK
jgi:hypothetical protein